jgi:hypothetical protein
LDDIPNDGTRWNGNIHMGSLAAWPLMDEEEVGAAPAIGTSPKGKATRAMSLFILM